MFSSFISHFLISYFFKHVFFITNLLGSNFSKKEKRISVKYDLNCNNVLVRVVYSALC
jgi:hypothetical protein